MRRVRANIWQEDEEFVQTKKPKASGATQPKAKASKSKALPAKPVVKSKGKPVPDSSDEDEPLSHRRK